MQHIIRMNKPFHILCHVGTGERSGKVDVRRLAYVYVDADIHVLVYQDDQTEFSNFAYTRSQLLGKAPPSN